MDDTLIEVNKTAGKCCLNNKDLRSKLLKVIELAEDRTAKCEELNTELEISLHKKRTLELELEQLEVKAHSLKANRGNASDNSRDKLKKERLT